MFNSKRNPMRGSLFMHRPSNNLFEEPNRGDTGPQELDVQSPNVAEDKPIESPEPNRRSSLAAEGTPATVCQRILEDNFMLDSLNEQRVSRPLVANKETKHLTKAVEISKEEKENEGLEMAQEKSDNFMNVIQTAITHFEKAPFTVANSRKPDVKKGLDLRKQSPSVSYNSSNTTTANSMGEPANSIGSKNDDYELLKKQHNALLAKYNELKSSNKGLMNDYAVLRSQLEEMKAVFLQIESLIISRLKQ